MQATFFYLHSCSTCQRIIKELSLPSEIMLQNIKEEPITPEQLELMISRSGSAESIFSKRAMKYRGLGLHEQSLTETDMRDWILKEYTFLKRPVLIIDDAIFIGNSKKVVAAAKEYLHGK